MEQIIDECVALALSKQSSHQQGHIDEMSASAKRKKQCHFNRSSTNSHRSSNPSS
jgi:hypothetical protein